MENEKKNSKKKEESPIEESAETKPKKAKKPNTPLEAEVPNDKRVPKIIGAILLMFSFVLAYSFISFLLNAQVDQSEVMNNASTVLTDSSIKVKNSGGRLGAVLGQLFIQNLFGIASFIICFIFFIAGTNLFLQKKVFTVFKTSLYAFLTMLWLSITLAFLNHFIMPQSIINWGGNFGNSLADEKGLLMGLLHPLGIGVLLAVTLLCFLIWVYNFNFDFLLNVFSKNEIPFTVQKNEPTNIVQADLKDDSPLFKDKSENIFGKDNIEETKNSFQVELLSPSNITDSEPDLEEAMEMENTSEDLGLDLQIVETPTLEEEIIEKVQPNLSTPYDPTQELSKYQFPSLDLLDEYSSEKVKYNPEELEANKNQIVSTLNNYQIEISKIKATIGPTVTLYEIVPAPGVRISKIKNLEDDIALSLAALGIRIIAPIPGKGTIGIEVPNISKEVVSMRSLLASEKFQNTTADLPICLGKSISNDIMVADLAKMPHLLMAGATGQGKSVGINSILVSLLYKKHPSQLKFIMVDPKKVELSLYEALEKHYLAKLPGEADAIITDIKKVVTTLNALCLEMDNRYDLLKKAQVRNIKEYNHKFINRQLNPQNGHQFLPYIVLVVDEFADLIMTAGKEVEMPIARLAQLARAIGIHLILATQRPSVNIITGTIKANFPARIAFKTTSKIDSRTILDTGGSEQLIGRGDMLLSQGSDLIRLQCGFVDTPEVEKIRNFIANQQGFSQAFLLPEYIDPNEEKGDDSFFESERDPLFEDAARVIVQNQMGSTSLIQRRMKLGYNRAGRLMDQLESAGIVGENLGSKAREVKIKTELELEQFLQKLKDV